MSNISPSKHFSWDQMIKRMYSFNVSLLIPGAKILLGDYEE
jgi:hypothetical protein